MAIFRKIEGLRQKLLNKTSVNGATNRISDVKRILYGGRGGNYDGLQYVRNINTDANQGIIATVAINLGGTGYTTNDVLTITDPGGGGTLGTITATTVASGVITAISLNNAGIGYVLTDRATTTGGTGTGAIIKITSLQPVVNQKLSDAWVKFAPANSSGSASNRYDHQTHDFSTNGSFP